jgi:hypothetical protein
MHALALATSELTLTGRRTRSKSACTAAGGGSFHERPAASAGGRAADGTAALRHDRSEAEAVSSWLLRRRCRSRVSNLRTSVSTGSLAAKLRAPWWARAWFPRIEGAPPLGDRRVRTAKRSGPGRSDRPRGNGQARASARSRAAASVGITRAREGAADVARPESGRPDADRAAGHSPTPGWHDRIRRKTGVRP